MNSTFNQACDVPTTSGPVKVLIQTWQQLVHVNNNAAKVTVAGLPHCYTNNLEVERFCWNNNQRLW